jgi:hypothetical protein
MPSAVANNDSIPITNVDGPRRPDLRRHVFVGGNFFLLGMLNRYRGELAVEAPSQELDAVAARTRELLAHAARVTVVPSPDAVPSASPDGSRRVVVDVEVTNLSGHKLPTAYPSRRAWLHFTVRDARGAMVFESGALMASGRIVGNDNDDDRTKYEPHYREIARPDQVQIYESIMRDPGGGVTTGLLSAVGYIKDNRILPRGFDKATAAPDIAVIGDAARDPAFGAGAHRTRYRVDVGRAPGPFRVNVELWYQPIGYRWAHNLQLQPAAETDRFVSYYDSMAGATGEVLARSGVMVP